MAGIRQIQPENWADHLRLITNGNKGRIVSIFTKDNEMGNNRLVDELPLAELEVDMKGNDADRIRTKMQEVEGAWNSIVRQHQEAGAAHAQHQNDPDSTDPQ